MSNLANLKDILLKSLEIDEFGDEILDEFVKLDKEQITEFIDLIIAEVDDVTSINNLIRIRESLSVVFDHKLLLISIKNILQAN